MKKGDYLIVWLLDSAAKLFLGLPEDGQVKRRWCIHGKIAQDIESPIGIWVEVLFLEEREISETAKVVRTWNVNPPICLVRWDFIIHAQIGEISKKEPLGFYRQAN